MVFNWFSIVFVFSYGFLRIRPRYSHIMLPDPRAYANQSVSTSQVNEAKADQYPRILNNRRGANNEQGVVLVVVLLVLGVGFSGNRNRGKPLLLLR